MNATEKKIVTTSSITEACRLAEVGTHCYIDTHPNGRSGGRRIRGYVIRRQKSAHFAGSMETVVVSASGRLMAEIASA